MSKQSISVLSLSVALTGSVLANRFVTPAGAQAGADAVALGVAKTDGGANDLVAVDVLGTAAVEAGASITVGQTLKVDAQGRAIPWASTGAKVGIALEPAGAAGQFIEVLLLPNA